VETVKMQGGLMMCSVYLQEVEEKLTEFNTSLHHAFTEKSRVTEALSFIYHARKAIELPASLDDGAEVTEA
jgi:hypothetical protein